MKKAAMAVIIGLLVSSVLGGCARRCADPCGPVCGEPCRVKKCCDQVVCK